MNDVLQVAIARQRELRDEIARLDQFIRQAQDLLRNAKAKSEPRPASVESPATAPRQERPEVARVEIPQARPQAEILSPRQEPEPATAERKFPWSSPQTPVRRASVENAAGPTRRNVFRREMSATG